MMLPDYAAGQCGVIIQGLARVVRCASPTSLGVPVAGRDGLLWAGALHRSFGRNTFTRLALDAKCRSRLWLVGAGDESLATACGTRVKDPKILLPQRSCLSPRAHR